MLRAECGDDHEACCIDIDTSLDIVGKIHADLLKFHVELNTFKSSQNLKDMTDQVNRKMIEFDREFLKLLGLERCLAKVRVKVKKEEEAVKRKFRYTVDKVKNGVVSCVPCPLIKVAQTLVITGFGDFNCEFTESIGAGAVQYEKDVVDEVVTFFRGFGGAHESNAQLPIWMSKLKDDGCCFRFGCTDKLNLLIRIRVCIDFRQHTLWGGVAFYDTLFHLLYCSGSFPADPEPPP